MTASQWPPDGHPSQQNNSTPNEPRVIVRMIGPDHPEHPRNVAKRAAEAAQKAAEEAAAAKIAEEAAALEAASAPPKKRRKRRSRRRPPAPPIPQDESAAERHERLCTICNHEDCADIEQEFVHWIHPETTAHYYEIDWRALYRHAHAKNLFPLRQRNLRFALGRMVELSASVTPTTDGVLRAIRAFSSLDRNGRWTEIPTHVVVSSGAQFAKTKLLPGSAQTVTLRSVLDAASEPTDAGSATEEPVPKTVLIDNQN